VNAHRVIDGSGPQLSEAPFSASKTTASKTAAATILRL
jgi:hypothetical protein